MKCANCNCAVSSQAANTKENSIQQSTKRSLNIFKFHPQINDRENFGESIPISLEIFLRKMFLFIRRQIAFLRLLWGVPKVSYCILLCGFWSICCAWVNAIVNVF